jgi:hypothetical protein
MMKAASAPSLTQRSRAVTPGRGATMQKTPTTAMPRPTPEYTRPANRARSALASSRSAHVLVATSVHALSSPAVKLSRSQIATPSRTPMAAVTTAVPTRLIPISDGDDKDMRPATRAPAR